MSKPTRDIVYHDIVTKLYYTIPELCELTGLKYFQVMGVIEKLEIWHTECRPIKIHRDDAKKYFNVVV